MPTLRSVAGCLMPLLLALLGAVGCGILGFFIATAYGAAAIEQHMAENNGDDGGASEGLFALITGLPIGFVLGGIVVLVLGLRLKSIYFDDQN